MGFFKRSVVATAMATAAVVLVGQGGAGADIAVSDVTTFLGTGTISPGLSNDCVVQTDITFNGTGVLVGDELAVPGNVTFDGNSGALCETLEAGAGSGTIGGTFSSAPNGVTYHRIGPIVLINGSGTVGVETHTVVAAVCIFVPSNTNPVTAYALVCAAALNS